MSKRRFDGDWNEDGSWEERKERVESRDWERQEEKFMQKKRAANYIRYYSQRLLIVGIFGLFIGSMIVVLGVLTEFSVLYNSLIAAFGGAFAAIAGIYAFSMRLKISRILAEMEE